MGADVAGTETIQSIAVLAGEMAANISVQLVDDTAEEDSETFFVILIGSNCCSHLPTIVSTVTTVEIIDDDEGN